MHFATTLIATSLLITMVANGMNAQPMSGTYTVANGNPGGAFDYGDLGDAFNDLEGFGVSGPVVLELYDIGGPFISNDSYGLGWTHGTATPVAGLSLSNSLTIRAAAGHAPVLSGSGVPLDAFPVHTCTLLFNGVGFTTIEGLTITGGVSTGIHWRNLAPQGNVAHFRIARCRIYNIVGAAVFFEARHLLDNVIIENNMCWDCGSAPGSGAQGGVIGATQPGVEWVYRHNTIIYDTGSGGAFFSSGASASTVDLIEGNVVYASGEYAHFWYSLNVAAQDWPGHSNSNVVFLTNQAKMSMAYGVETWAEWQAAGFDLDGLNTDPLLVDITPGFEDLRLSAASPARDLIAFGSVSDDIFGNPRPMGARWDAGAHEYPASEIEVSYQAAPVAYTGSVDVGVVPFIGSARAFTVSSTGFGDLELSGTPPVDVNPGLNCTAATGVQSQPALTTIPPNGSTTFTLFIQPAAAGPFDLAVSIESNDIAANPFTFTVTGTAIPNGAAQADAVSGFGGFTNGPFTLSLAPGEAVSGAIELTDPEGDTITVSAIMPPAAMPTGIIAPTIPAPGGPHTLAWSGVADASNAPGDYSWLVEFSDAGNGMPVSATVTITIREPIVIHSPSRLPDGRVGESYSIAIQATGGAGGFTRTLTGDLPQGLTFNALNGSITGKPEIAGDYQFTVEFEDTTGSTANKLFDLKINPNPKGSPTRNEGSCTAGAAAPPHWACALLAGMMLWRRERRRIGWHSTGGRG